MNKTTRRNLRDIFKKRVQSLGLGWNLEDAKDGGFQDKRAEDAWALFMSGREEGMKDKRALGRDLKDMKHLIKGHCVIARVRDDGSPCFSQKPYQHRTLPSVITEYDRLTALHPGSKFAIYHWLNPKALATLNTESSEEGTL